MDESAFAEFEFVLRAEGDIYEPAREPGVCGARAPWSCSRFFLFFSLLPLLHSPAVPASAVGRPCQALSSTAEYMCDTSPAYDTSQLAHHQADIPEDDEEEADLVFKIDAPAGK